MSGNRNKARGKTLSQYGLLDIPNLDSDMGGNNNDVDDDDDEDLEAELAALTGGSHGAKPKKLAAPLPSSQLDMMVAASLKDLPSDDDESVDENDPELLGELSELQGGENESVPSTKPEESFDFPVPTSRIDPVVVLLTERLNMYQTAESNAKENNDASKARRFGRGIKTISEMLKKAQKGETINQDDIPPPVSIAKPKPPDQNNGQEGTKPNVEPENKNQPIRGQLPPPLEPTRIAPTLPLHPEKLKEDNPPPPIPPRSAPSTPQETPTPSSPVQGENKIIDLLTIRQNEYKRAALEAKKSGDAQSALNFISIYKQFEAVITLAKSGQTIDLSDMPPSPSELTKVPQNPPQTAPPPLIVEDGHQGSSHTEQPAEPTTASSGIPEEPKTVLEALNQRLSKYQSQEESAKSEGNSGKARRMGRIVKQYQDAIKLHKAGKPIPVDELPTPPGYPPIPVEGGPAVSTTPIKPPQPSPSVTPKPQPSPEPTKRASLTPQPDATKVNIRKSPGTRQEKQLQFLIERQKLFKLAALNAKKKGEMNHAKEYLRLVKQIDPLIAASESGLPVDLNTIPIPPEDKKSLESEFDVISIDECIEGSDSDIYEKLQHDLLEQLKMCMRTRDHFKAVGDIASANKFEQLALHSKKDLDVIKVAQKRSDPIPKFHYEERIFNMIICNTELNDNDLELSIVRGISYNVTNAKEIDTYVKYTFPYPTETPPVGKTDVIYDTNNPEYNAVFTLSIQRNVRACQRVFKRHAIKLEIWSKGGFFRSDTLVGTVNVKLQPLETKCTLHEAFDLMDGRKTLGGKLEVKIKIRNPILTKQLDKVREKWLVIDRVA